MAGALLLRRRGRRDHGRRRRRLRPPISSVLVALVYLPSSASESAPLNSLFLGIEATPRLAVGTVTDEDVVEAVDAAAPVGILGAVAEPPPADADATTAFLLPSGLFLYPIAAPLAALRISISINRLGLMGFGLGSSSPTASAVPVPPPRGPTADSPGGSTDSSRGAAVLPVPVAAWHHCR